MPFPRASFIPRSFWVIFEGICKKYLQVGYNIVTYSMCNYVQVCHFVQVCASISRYEHGTEYYLSRNTCRYLYIYMRLLQYLHIVSISLTWLQCPAHICNTYTIMQYLHTHAIAAHCAITTLTHNITHWHINAMPAFTCVYQRIPAYTGNTYTGQRRFARAT